MDWKGRLAQLFFPSHLCSSATLSILLLLASCSSKDDDPRTFTLSVSVSPTEGGTVSNTDGSFNQGERVSVTATASAGYAFAEWTGDVQSTDNPVTITMDSNKIVRAIFDVDVDGDGVPDEQDLCSNTPSGVEVDADGCIIFLFRDENDVTIKAFDYAEVGDTGVINGVTYTIVDETMLRTMVANDEDVSTVCTTKVTDMSALFQSKVNFNGNIITWDVSNVTNMANMFFNTQAFNQDIGAWDVGNVADMSNMF